MLAVAAVALTEAAPASAQSACHFEGLAGGLSPGIPDISTDAGLFDPETGSYDLAGDETCAGGVASGSFSSLGTYLNTICGSGTWRGTWNNGFSYRFELSWGSGVIYIPASSPVPSGHVQLTPGNSVSPTPGGDNCVSSPDGKTDSFRVVRDFAF